MSLPELDPDKLNSKTTAVILAAKSIAGGDALLTAAVLLCASECMRATAPATAAASLDGLETKMRARLRAVAGHIATGRGIVNEALGKGPRT